METSGSPSDWRAEANAIIRDIEQHVHKISISNLPNSQNKILFNMTTLERKDFCVELTKQGFRIVGEKYDSEDKKGKYSVYETPYSMLDNLSPAYRDSFGEELFEKLKNLKIEREQRHLKARSYSSDDEDDDEESVKSNEENEIEEKVIEESVKSNEENEMEEKEIEEKEIVENVKTYEEKESKESLKYNAEKEGEENMKITVKEKETEDFMKSHEMEKQTEDNLKSTEKEKQTEDFVKTKEMEKQSEER